MATDWLAKHPKDVYFRYYLSNLAMVRNDFAAAEPHLKTILQQQPENALVLDRMARVAWQLKRPDALKYAEKANSLQPDRAAFVNTWSTILASEGKLDKAIEIQRRVVTVHPENHALRLNLAKLYLKAGDKARAKKELDALQALGNGFRGQKEVQDLLGSL
jgi:predicted Zn-dependent protease